MTTQTAATPVLDRILAEGYGKGAWHGPDMNAALTDVTAELAFRRPAKGRHSIAEIALHHAYTVRSVRAKLSGTAPEPFLLEGDDWFEVGGKTGPSWAQIRGRVEDEQRRLAELVAKIAAGRAKTSLDETERFDLVLGITCHAVYHAGQIQLVKKLVAA